MNNPLPISATAPSYRRYLFNRYTAVAFLVGATLTASIGGLARAEVNGSWHHGMMMDGSHSPADVSAHIDHMLKHFYVEIDATDAQKAQIGPVVKQAVNDLMPLHAQLHAAHADAMQALAKPSVDRTSLEAARVEHMQLAEQASKRIVQLLADVGDVLTVPQRKALADHLERMHGMPHS